LEDHFPIKISSGVFFLEIEIEVYFSPPFIIGIDMDSYSIDREPESDVKR